MIELLRLWADGKIDKAEYDNRLTALEWERVQRKDGRWVWRRR